MRITHVGLPLTLLSFAAVAAAQVGPAGTEFQVNSYTSENQYQVGRAICQAADGDFVVVWQSSSPYGGNPDISHRGIFAQRYASSGAAIGTEFQVNTYTTGLQVDPAVCCPPDGDFVVTWTNGPIVFSPTGFVSGQRFSSSGTAIGTEFQVNSYTSNLGFNSDVCCAADGDFVVVWDEFTYFPALVLGQRYDSAGSPQGPPFQVNAYTTAEVLEPGVCCSATGDFVVAWTEMHNSADADVFARRYASNGSARGTEFQVNAYTQGIQTQSYGIEPENQAICCDQAGNFTIAWTTTTVGSINADVHARRFAADGAFRGDEFQVTAYTSGYQSSPAVCCGANDSFVVVWQSLVGSSYPAPFFIFGRQFAPDGAPLTGDFQVNTYTSGSTFFPTVACAPDSGFVVSWSQYPNEDGSRNGVFAQRYAPPPTTVPSPTLTWVGLASAVVGLLSVGLTALWRRR